MSGFSLGCSLGHSHRHTHRQTLTYRYSLRQEQTPEQRLEHRQEQMRRAEGYYQRFIGFVGAAHELKIRPMATCPKCEHQLCVAEIVLGFTTDVTDLTTGCPRCKARFQATNLLDKSTGKEVAFFCPDQVLDQLSGKERMEAQEIRAKHPDIYGTAIFHFGSLLNAFARKGIEYRRETFDWKAKSREILGKVPDRDISKIFGVSLREVQSRRDELDIARFTGRKTIIPADWKPSDN
jgi:hypothetical protein